MNIKSIIPYFMITMVSWGLVSCEDDSSKIPVEEPIKIITGNWKVSQIIRNGENLTERLKIDKYTIDFKEDGTYLISDQLPFIVKGAGTYVLGDSQYPFTLRLKPAAVNNDITVKLQYPVIKGKRQLSLSLSLGCTGNTYEYNFERTNTGI